MSNILLGQVFYGRGPDGYGILGVSPAGRPIVAMVADLCRTVGTPDRPGENPSFLLEKRTGSSVVMIRACRGSPDSTGRATVFFHALVTDMEMLQAENLDAFVLADAGAFSTTCPGRNPPDLSIPVPKPRPSRSNGPRSLEFPATVSSEHPLDALVRRELGPDVLKYDWATFSYNPLPGFDLCVLSAYSPHKGDGIQYTFDETEIHRLSGEEKKSAQSNGISTISPVRRIRKPTGVFLVSLAANAVLLLALLLSGDKTGRGNVVADPPQELTEDEAKARWSEKWKKEWKESLPPLSLMTEEEAKAKWESKWRLQWETALPASPPPMTEEEAKAKWESKWKLQWEESTPAEESAKTKWGEKWKNEWRATLENEWRTAMKNRFEETLTKNCGDPLPLQFDQADSVFTKTIRDAQDEPEDPIQKAKWRMFRTCKACSEFIVTNFYKVPTNSN